MNTPQTFTAHGHTWTSHTPGDAMPCDGEVEVYAILTGGHLIEEATAAHALEWGDCRYRYLHNIIGWRYATPAQEKVPSELDRVKAENESLRETLNDIRSDVAEYAQDGESPNAGPRDRLAAKVMSHITFEESGKLPWHQKQIAGLEESLRLAKQTIDSQRTRFQTIYDLTEGSADGAPDATAHDKLALEVSSLAKSFLP